MEVIALRQEQEISLANSLKTIYYCAFIEDEFSDDSGLLETIQVLVEDSIRCQKEIFNANPEVSYRISSTKQLAEAFFKKYSEILDNAETIAYSINNKVGYSTDIASIICPYVLCQMGVTSENVSFYIGLGMVIANIICDMLAKKQEDKIATQDKLENEEIKKICQEMKKYLDNSTNTQGSKEESIQQLQDSIENIEQLTE